jgi:hypothetical protein
MIKIVSGWSNPGGSTTAHINLCNLFNENNMDCIFYGPHEYHLSKCISDNINKLSILKDDIVILHFMTKEIKANAKKLIFSCHEQNIFPLNKINYTNYDFIHYVSEHQYNYHKVDYPHYIIPNVVDDIKPTTKPKEKIGGVIGSIDENKQVHVSIQKAIDDGCDKVFIYGKITDTNYYNKEVAPLIDGLKVRYKGYCDDKQEMYNQLTDVYQDSLMESWGYISRECKLAGINYHGNGVVNDDSIMSNDEILNKWVEVLQL